MTVAALLEREVRRDGARPFLTWYDDATGARVELSVATTANWAAKIANHLTDEGVEPGEAVGVAGVPHWITAVVLLGAWTAGAHVDFSAAVTLDVTYDPMGAALSGVVGGQPDVVVVPATPSTELALSLAGRSWTHDELARAADHGARAHGLDASTRVLSTLSYDTVDGIDAGLLAPLACGGSVVLVANVDAAKLAAKIDSENVTQTAGVGVLNIPRLDQPLSAGS